MTNTEIKNLRDELRTYRFEFDLIQKIPCSKQENKEYQKLLKENGVLPDGVYAYVNDGGVASTTQFYTVYETDLTESEITEYLTYKKLKLISTIKNCIIFFTVLTILVILVYLFIISTIS